MTSTLSAFSPGAGQTRSAVPKPQTAIGPAPVPEHGNAVPLSGRYAALGHQV